MYFPYFRGKQWEIRAIVELASFLKNSGRVIPILEPVRHSDDDAKRLTKLAQLGVPLIVIENPAKGELAEDHQWPRDLLGRLSPDRVRPGFLVGSTTATKTVESFLRRHSGRSVAFVHMGSAPQPEKLSALQKKAGNVEFNVFLAGKSGKLYLDTFSIGKSVILEDGFERQARNEEYPPSDFFSDRFKTYAEDGFQGFGDFLIVGNYFTKSGGGALAVAIHLTNLENGGLVVRHFLSDRKTLRNVDTAGKFHEALQKVMAFIRSRQNWRITQGCREFLEQKDYKGLGHVKKVSMKHHVELMDALLASMEK